MLYMVIERFKNGDPGPVGERFRRQGRMLPEGVTYVASWMQTNGASCYQLMEAPTEDSLGPWMARWSDLVDFEVIPVLPSAEYWAQPTRPSAPSSR
jgi:hypothetical protein